MTDALTTRPLGAAGLLLMAAAISIAWGFEIIGGLIPCALCLEQRVPYYAAIPTALVALVLFGRWRLAARFLFAVAAVLMVLGAGLGVYHAGAEWAFWAGPNTCGVVDAEVRDAASLLSALEETRLVTCTQDTGRVLGLSFAGWNVVAAGSAAVLLAGAALRPAQASGR